MANVLFVLELIGAAAFAIAGSYAARDKGLDLFGALVLGCVNATGGGLLRDVLLGRTPPALFHNPVYVAVAAGVSLLAFIAFYFAGDWIAGHQKGIDRVVNVFDAFGLGAFAVVGVQVAESFGVAHNGFLSLCVGVLTAVGGGLTRDVLICRIPAILHKRVYAVAALLGACVYYFLPQLGVAPWVAIAVAVSAVVAVRMLATVFEWSLPRLKRPE